jgi:hypothetical protein
VRLIPSLAPLADFEMLTVLLSYRSASGPSYPQKPHPLADHSESISRYLKEAASLGNIFVGISYKTDIAAGRAAHEARILEDLAKLKGKLP